MSRILSILGVLMLAFVLFVGLIHVFLKVQKKDSRQTLESLHAMPVIGGFFHAPPPEVPEPTVEEKREGLARQTLLDSREFFPLPDGIDRKSMEDLIGSIKDALTRYEQGLSDVERERIDLARISAELETMKESLASAAKEVAKRAMELQGGREELELKANRMAADEMRNLKASALMYEQMAPEAAVLVLAELEVDVVAKTLKGMSPKKSAKLLAAMKPARAVEVTKRLQAITIDEPVGAKSEG